MSPNKLRKALEELKGKRTATFVFQHILGEHNTLAVANAMLVPEEADGLIKLTDGQSIYIIDAERVMVLARATLTTLSDLSGGFEVAACVSPVASGSIFSR